MPNEASTEIKANNRFIAEDERTNSREPPDQAFMDRIKPQKLQTMINANNYFIVKDGTRGERGSIGQMRADPVAFEQQRFKPTIKVNNHFIAEDERNYRRPPENGSVLLEQQHFQPAINANNHFIKENSRNYKRGRLQQYNQGAVTGLRVPNDKAINRS